VENALDLFTDYDIIVDGTDNFPTRYLVNDACVCLASERVWFDFRFEGQIAIFWRASRARATVASIQNHLRRASFLVRRGGVLGVLPGIVGTIQAAETLKLIIGKGDPLIGRLLLFDALG